MPSMKQRYKTEMRGRDPETVDTLFLDNSGGGKIGGINAELTNLSMLSMVKCGLTNLTGFPRLPSLTYLDISDNQLGDDAKLHLLVENAPELERITLLSNQLERITLLSNQLSLENLRPLKMLTNLSELDLWNNQALGNVEEYRVRLFEMIPTLKIIDGCDINGEEVENDLTGEEGEDSEDGSGSDNDEDDYVPQCAAPRGNKRSAATCEEEPKSKKATPK